MTNESDTTSRPEAPTVAGRLADIIRDDNASVRVGLYRLSLSDRDVVEKALRAVNDRDALIAERDALREALEKTRVNLVGLSRGDDDVFASMIRRIDKALEV